MKQGEISKRLVGKVGLHSATATRHLSYELRSTKSGKIGLPRLLRIGKHRGDVPKNVIGSIARNLGLTEHEFRTMIRCSIRGECVRIAIARFCCVAPTLFGLTERSGWPEDTHPLAETIATLLDELPEKIEKPNSSEVQLLMRLREGDALRNSKEGALIMKRINYWLGAE